MTLGAWVFWMGTWNESGVGVSTDGLIAPRMRRRRRVWWQGDGQKIAGGVGGDKGAAVAGSGGTWKPAESVTMASSIGTGVCLARTDELNESDEYFGCEELSCA